MIDINGNGTETVEQHINQLAGEDEDGQPIVINQDSRLAKLMTAVYKHIGAEMTDVLVAEPNNGQKPAPTGWFLLLGDEEELIHKDGKIKASLQMCACIPRSPASKSMPMSIDYYASVMFADGVRWFSTTEDNGEWVK